jgi:hypothetical protein
MDNNSTHSNASATSTGTTFTKEDGHSLCTTLTESFIEDMKTQTAQQNQTITDLITNQLKRDKAYRQEQAETRKEQAAQFSQLINLFATNHISAPAGTSTHSYSPPEHHRKTREKAQDQQKTTTPTDSPNRYMLDTDSSTSGGERTNLDKGNLPRFTTAEWAAQQAKEPSSASSQTDSSEEDYTIYNKKGRCITELTSQEIALDAAEAAEYAAANAADATIAAQAAADKADKANKAAATAATVAAKLAAERRHPKDTHTSNEALPSPSERSRSRSPNRRTARARMQTNQERRQLEQQQRDEANHALLIQRCREFRTEPEDYLLQRPK